MLRDLRRDRAHGCAVVLRRCGLALLDELRDRRVLRRAILTLDRGERLARHRLVIRLRCARALGRAALGCEIVVGRDRHGRLPLIHLRVARALGSDIERHRRWHLLHRVRLRRWLAHTCGLGRWTWTRGSRRPRCRRARGCRLRRLRLLDPFSVACLAFLLLAELVLEPVADDIGGRAAGHGLGGRTLGGDGLRRVLHLVALRDHHRAADQHDHRRHREHGRTAQLLEQRGPPRALRLHLLRLLARSCEQGDHALVARLLVAHLAEHRAHRRHRLVEAEIVVGVWLVGVVARRLAHGAAFARSLYSSSSSRSFSSA